MADATQQELPEDRVRAYVEAVSALAISDVIADVDTENGPIELLVSDTKDTLYELEFARALLAAHEARIRADYSPGSAVAILATTERVAREALQ